MQNRVKEKIKNKKVNNNEIMKQGEINIKRAERIIIYSYGYRDQRE